MNTTGVTVELSLDGRAERLEDSLPAVLNQHTSEDNKLERYGSEVVDKSRDRHGRARDHLAGICEYKGGCSEKDDTHWVDDGFSRGYCEWHGSTDCDGKPHHGSYKRRRSQERWRDGKCRALDGRGRCWHTKGTHRSRHLRYIDTEEPREGDRWELERGRVLCEQRRRLEEDDFLPIPLIELMEDVAISLVMCPT
jgi:hypothetical protein